MSQIKIATWNVNSLKVRLPHVLDWLQTKKPDILAIQETKSIDENFPAAAINDAGYEVIYSGQKTYNGMAIISKKPAQEILTDIPSLDDPQRRILIASFDHMRIINLYVPNGQDVASDKYQYKLNWLQKITDFVQSELAKYPNLVVLGDFNIAPADEDVYDPEVWKDKVLCSKPERQALENLINTGITDSFRLFEQAERSYTWWDYRMMAFRRKRGLRIDYILVTEALAKACKECVVDIEPRKLERPSDHAPVLATFDLG